MATARISEVTHRYPFLDAKSKPQWAQLTRLGGDRVAILFEDLRRQISVIDGLVEELHYFGSEWGWLPRYRVGGQVLFAVQIRPGSLSATVEMPEAMAKNLLNSPATAGRMMAWLRAAAIREGIALLRVRLTGRILARSFAKLIIQVQKGLV